MDKNWGETIIDYDELLSPPKIDIEKLPLHQKESFHIAGKYGLHKIKNILAPTHTADYEILKLLGEGSFGKAFLAKIKQTGELVVIKKSGRKQSDEEFRTLYRIRKACDKYLLCVRGYFTENKYRYIVVDYLPRSTDLRQVCEGENCKTMSIPMKFYITQQLLKGLYTLHEYEIAHRDIKPDNIIITDKLDVRYIDYGLSCEGMTRIENKQTKLKKRIKELIEDEMKNNLTANGKTELKQYKLQLGRTHLEHRINERCMDNLSGTNHYIPPSLRHSKHIDIYRIMDGDVYALGITLYQLYFCKRSFLFDYLRYEQDFNTMRDSRLRSIVESEDIEIKSSVRNGTVSQLLYILFHHIINPLCSKYSSIQLLPFINGLPKVAELLYKQLFVIKDQFGNSPPVPSPEKCLEILNKQALLDARIYFSH